MEFNDFKNEILRRAKEADACSGEYRRAYQSNDYSELMQVIKDNFDFAVRRKVIDPSLIESYKDQFTANQIYCNVDVTAGFLLASGNATVRASGNATVRASGNATVEAWGNATVEASGNATVRASGNATVRASGNAYITSHYTIECKLRDNAIYRIRESNTVRYVSDNINFEKVPAYEPEGTETKQD
ncbi:MAG: hypothetical protein LIO79_07715 [Rikenellaceae bacterium]|nr:hypothetical protein [Rikenellaceae bacterium]